MRNSITTFTTVPSGIKSFPWNLNSFEMVFVLTQAPAKVENANNQPGRKSVSQISSL